MLLTKQICINIYIPILLIISLFSCSREFNDNDDYNFDTPVEVLGDNSFLFSKIFHQSQKGYYLWFDIRNEIANFSKPQLPFYYTDKAGNDRYKKIDLRGRLYEYNHEAQELKILNYPLNIFNKEEHSADIVYSFTREYDGDCSSILDSQQRILCERTYLLKLKYVDFSHINLVVEINIPTSHNKETITIQNMEEKFYLTN